ncbi:MAG: hypothetical protein V1793_06295 [Pseudomonadota bacterium]
MKQYLIDGLRPGDHQKLKAYLDEHHGPAVLGNIYWFKIDPEILTPLQREHTGCSPHVFALELDERFLSCELLVRIRGRIKCDCMAYATRKQREWIMDTMDAMLEILGITI